MDFTGASWFHSDELEIDRTATMVPRRDPIKVTKVFQVHKTECASSNNFHLLIISVVNCLHKFSG